MSKQNKRETVAEELQRRIDQLIDHYEKFCPPGTGSTIQVDCTVDALVFAHRDEHGNCHYRGRILIPVHREPMSRREFQARHETI